MNSILYSYRVFIQPPGGDYGEKEILEGLHQLPDLGEVEIAMRYLTVRFVTSVNSVARVHQALGDRGIKIVSIHSSSSRRLSS